MMMWLDPVLAHWPEGERDEQKMLVALWMKPLSDVKTLAKSTGQTENRCYKMLLAKNRQVSRATMGRGENVRAHYWLSDRGVLDVVDLTGWAIPWQVSETGIGWQVRRLNTAEAIYPILPQVWDLLGADVDRPNSDLDITAFRWMREGPVDAVLESTNGAWIAFVWIGSMVTENKLREKASLATEQWQGRHTPAAWVIVCHDRLAARQAAEIWPGEHVLVLTIDGHVERGAVPGLCTPPPPEEHAAVKLGRPQRIVNWLDENHKNHNPALLAINGRLAYEGLRLTGEFPGWTPGQLPAALGESYRATVRRLESAGLVEKLDGGLYQTRLGMTTIARMDRISPQDVHERGVVYLDKAGAYRSQQEDHNRACIEVFLALQEEEGVHAFGGFRGLRDIPGRPRPSRISPDLVLCLHRPTRPTLMIYVEVEFTAASPEDIRRKLRPYVLLQGMLGQPVALAFIAADETVERMVQELGDDLPMLLTTNWDRVAEDVQSGRPMVWKFHGREGNIHALARFRDAWDDRRQTGQ